MVLTELLEGRFTDIEQIVSKLDTILTFRVGIWYHPLLRRAGTNA